MSVLRENIFEFLELQGCRALKVASQARFPGGLPGVGSLWTSHRTGENFLITHLWIALSQDLSNTVYDRKQPDSQGKQPQPPHLPALSFHRHRPQPWARLRAWEYHLLLLPSSLAPWPRHQSNNLQPSPQVHGTIWVRGCHGHHCLCSSQIHVLKPYPQCDSTWRFNPQEVIRFRWGHEGGAPWGSVPLKKRKRPEPSLCPGCAQQEGGHHLHVGKLVLTRHHTGWGLDLGLPASQTEKSKFLLWVSHPLYGV